MRLSLRKKVMVAVLLMALIVAGATALVSYNMYARSMEEHYERLTMNTARSAASMVDVQAVAELKDRTRTRPRTLRPLMRRTGTPTMPPTTKSSKATPTGKPSPP